MNEGDVWESEYGRTFTIVEICDDVIVVDVERVTLDKKTGELTTEINRREIPNKDFKFFSLAYKPEKKSR